MPRDQTPISNPKVTPLSPDTNFAEEISEDLLEDAVDALKLLRSAPVISDREGGIPLEEIGIHTKETTQKIVIADLPSIHAVGDEDETIHDIPKSDVEAAIAARMAAEAEGAPAVGDHEETESALPATEDEDERRRRRRAPRRELLQKKDDEPAD